ncbi:thermonuclease family protein [[Mycoplasma] collis]|uniref:thermonuclease family protein n=1 Tax=[Mycoplasma] collis TaxID=2127 RepID=UPI000A9DDC04|nr:thermonuclease family protein [[Mycoplasma] collis]
MVLKTKHKRKKSKKFLDFFSSIFLFFTFSFFVSCNFNQNKQTVKIGAKKIEFKNKKYSFNVYDGDTFTIINNESSNIKIRIFGIDTPEIKDKKTNEFTKNEKYLYAIKAKNFLNYWLEKHSNFDYDVIKKDKYNRTVAKIFDKDNDYSIDIVNEGLAIVRYISIDSKDNLYFTNDQNYYQKLLNAQKYAQKNKKGFWSRYNNLKQILKEVY